MTLGKNTWSAGGREGKRGVVGWRQVVLSNIHKRYGAVHAVRDVNLTIPDGAFAVLVGPSGCGKSTTLRMIAGLEEISGGSIAIGDRVVNALPPKDRDVAMVFQNYALYQHMTVYDNLAFGLRNRKVPEAKIGEEIERAVSILGIRELLARKPRQLSGGQQQRVALGRCIVRHPQVFLFDEPLSNLDTNLRAQMRGELKRLRERVPTTSIYVTHDQVEAMTLGDLVVVMKDGAVHQVGTPLEVYNRPANRFVASFIGAPAMNLFEVTIGGDESVTVVETQDLALRVPSMAIAPVGAYRGRSVVLGIRPEQIAVVDASALADTIFEATVEVTEQLGCEMHLDVRLGQAVLTVARVPPESRISVGDRVRLSVPPQQLYFFDRDSGHAIHS
jgi:multiple sugar transport system ATP-binding protein